MWRAFFLAIGVILIIGGLECMVVSRFILTEEARIPNFVSKIMGDESSPGNRPQTASVPFSPNVAPPQFIGNRSGYGGTPGSMSKYGPSKFAGQYGNDQFTNLSASAPNVYNPKANQPFSLAGYGTPTSQGPQPTNPPTIGPVKILHTKDWMPWSMIAAGVIVVLYTNTQSRRHDE